MARIRTEEERKNLETEWEATASRQKREFADLGSTQYSAINEAARLAAENEKKKASASPGAVYKSEPVSSLSPTSGGATVPGTEKKQLLSEDVLEKLYNGEEKFDYDFTTSPNYQRLAALYEKQGRAAAKDSFARAAAASGGYGNTYAQHASQEAYGDSMDKLDEAAIALEEREYQRWLNERADLKDEYSMLAAREAADREEAWREKEWEQKQAEWAHTLDMDDWQMAQTEKEFEENKAQFWATHSLNEKKFALDKWATEKGIELDEKQLDLAARQQSWNETMDMLNYNENKRQFDVSSNQNQQKINNDYALSKRELDMRESGSYFDQTSGSGSSGTTSGADRVNKNGISTAKKADFDAAVQEVYDYAMNLSAGSEEEFAAKLETFAKRYKDWGTILDTVDNMIEIDDTPIPIRNLKGGGSGVSKPASQMIK